MKLKVYTIIGLLLLLVASIARADIIPPREIIEQATTRLFDAIEKDRAVFDADRTKLYDLAGEIILPHFDFARMSRLVIKKKYWKKASKDTRQAFINAFRDYLVRTYSTALIKFEVKKIQYLPSKKTRRPNELIIRTKIHLARAKPVPIDYKCYLSKSDAWKVFDVKVDGISLIINNRNSYNKILKKSGMTGLIEVLSKREDTTPEPKVEPE